MKRKLEIAFSALLVLIFAYALFESRNWRFHARLLPWVVGVPMLFLACGQLLVAIRSKAAINDEVESSDVADEIPLPLARKRALSIALWLFGLFVAIWLVGFSISIPLFTLLYLKLESQERWWLAILLSALTWLFLFSLFEWTLNVPFPKGELLEWLNLAGE
jgi:hypothetical protein